MSQIRASRRGEATEEVAKLAEAESIPVDKLVQRVARGSVVIIKNAKKLEGGFVGVGEGLRTKVNANVGTSPEVCDPNLEVEKARAAERFGADTVMDLSTGGDLDEVRRKILKAVSVPVGTVPIYQAAIDAARRRGAAVEMTEDDIFNTIEKHLSDGVDFITVHVGITKELVKEFLKGYRVAGIVSRGGAITAAWTLRHDAENPLYARFDYLLEIASEYDAVLSLGDALRPGSVLDASDPLQIGELVTIGRLVKRCRKAGVQCMVEGPGHVPLDQIEANVKMEKTVCDNAPFYVLGPLVTDVAPGYDHISAAIGAAVAGAAGADLLCYVTRAEHLGLPTVEDVIEGVVALRIAAHAADIAKYGAKAMKWDEEVSKARARLDWASQIKLAMDPEKASEIRRRYPSTSGCTMCGEWCVYKVLSQEISRRRG